MKTGFPETFDREIRLGLKLLLNVLFNEIIFCDGNITNINMIYSFQLEVYCISRWINYIFQRLDLEYKINLIRDFKNIVFNSKPFINIY